MGIKLNKKGGDIMRDLKITREKSNSGWDIIGRIWSKHPELRLYQIITGLANAPNIQTMTEEEILKNIQRVKIKTM